MKYDWDPEKNERLKEERGISFEDIIFHLSQGDLWKVGDHPNQEKYLGQHIYFVAIEVPHRQTEKSIFLKTIIPSRKATRDFKKETESKK